MNTVLGHAQDRGVYDTHRAQNLYEVDLGRTTFIPRFCAFLLHDNKFGVSPITARRRYSTSPTATRKGLNAYEHAPVQERAFGDEAGTRCTLAIARLARGELDGAAAAMEAVFELPASQRTHGVVSAVENVERHITEITTAPRTMKELADAIHSFGTQRLALPL
jgi:hypothetical protein